MCFVLDYGFNEFLSLGLYLSFKARCLPQIVEGLCLAGNPVLTKTKGIIWCAFGVVWVISRGVVLF